MGGGGIENVALLIFISAVDGGEWSDSRPGQYTAGERAPSTGIIGVWVEPSAGLDAVEKRRISCPCRESNPGRPASSLEGDMELLFY
jgi:hypothetical protein